MKKFHYQLTSLALPLQHLHRSVLQQSLNIDKIRSVVTRAEVQSPTSLISLHSHLDVFEKLFLRRDMRVFNESGFFRFYPSSSFQFSLMRSLIIPSSTLGLEFLPVTSSRLILSGLFLSGVGVINSLGWVH